MDKYISTAEQLGSKVDDVPLQSAELLRTLISFQEINDVAGYAKLSSFLLFNIYLFSSSKRSDLEAIKQIAFHFGCILVTGLIIKFTFASYNGIFTYIL